MADAEVLRTQSFSDALIRNFNNAHTYVRNAVDGADDVLDSVASFLSREQEFEAVAQALEPAEVSDETPGTSIQEEVGSSGRGIWRGLAWTGRGLAGGLVEGGGPARVACAWRHLPQPWLRPQACCT